MKIVVLNGSPKGDNSVTMQYVKYMQKKHPEHEYKVFNIAQQIRQIEKDAERFNEIVDAVREATGVLWAFPLYIMLVHAGLVRFIELITERNAQDAFAGKHAAALSTSIHFFDHTAHNYIRAVSEDLGMRFADSFSAEMEDLMKPAGRAQFERFASLWLKHIEEGRPAPRRFAPIAPPAAFAYKPGAPAGKISIGNKKAVVIADYEDDASNVAQMAARFAQSFSTPAEIVNLRNADILGGCLGCLKCGFDNECAYDGKDSVRALYERTIGGADIVAFALELKGRYFSSRYKTFVDRRFFRTHQPQMNGKQLVYLVSGPLGQNHNVLEIIQATTDFDMANLAGTVTDESADSSAIDAAIGGLAQTCAENAEAGYVRPMTFLGVGGWKLFRDDMYGHLRFVFQADHKYYKKHGLYDFPQKDIRTRVQNAIMMSFFRIPSIRKHVREELPKHMTEGFRGVTG